MEQKWLWLVGAVVVVAIAATVWVETKKDSGDRAASGPTTVAPVDSLPPGPNDSAQPSVSDEVPPPPSGGLDAKGSTAAPTGEGGPTFEPPPNNSPAYNPPAYAPPDGQGFDSIPPPPPQNYSDTDDSDGAPPPPPPAFDGGAGSGDSDYAAPAQPSNDQEN